MPTTITVLGVSGLAASVGSYLLRGQRKRRGDQMPKWGPDWLAHDGTGCPLPPNSRPGVLFRSGWSSDVGLRPAGSWDHCWEWTTPGTLDIVAYKPEPEQPAL